MSNYSSCDFSSVGFCGIYICQETSDVKITSTFSFTIILSQLGDQEKFPLSLENKEIIIETKFLYKKKTGRKVRIF